MVKKATSTNPKTSKKPESELERVKRAIEKRQAAKKSTGKIAGAEKKATKKKAAGTKRLDKSTRAGAQERFERFAREYLVDLNATQAAIRAGYSRRTAYSQGHDLLKKPEVQSILAEERAKLIERTLVTAEYIILGLKEVAERCMQHKPVLDREGNETGDYVFEHAGANKALELLGKHLGLFSDKQIHEFGDSVAALMDRISGKTKGPPSERGVTR